ncbi:MAG TPA: nitrate reductase subunit beta [Terriglobales bacterium]|nr:nitrate reductase subunit beta [Terriglobales bacterium]
MNVRAQVSMVFHLDKCIGCHTCSLACKNLWTDRPGTEYMWWNNVETKPGTGYPTLYEDQEQYRGGWELRQGKLQLRLAAKATELANLGYNPRLPSLDDYYEPWTYRYSDLFDAPLGSDQPVARPVSLITGRDLEIEAGPNWDDDLGGSEIYAANDPNLKKLSPDEQRDFFGLQQLVYFYLPRICNHCLNPSCVAACPSGAIYKRGEDGIVLVNQEKCQGWRMCVSGCPYKKVYFNYQTGKAEKCILCYPRLESGYAPACFHTCPGRIRYLGVLLYDADRIQEAASQPEDALVEAQKALILDPFDPAVLAAARRQGVDDKVLDAAQRSPTYKYVKLWNLALPLHPEWRTLPMLFYVPPLLPVLATVAGGCYELAPDFFTSVESVRLPIRYLASLFSAGDEDKVIAIYRKLIAARMTLRSESVGDITAAAAAQARQQANLSRAEVEGIYQLTSIADEAERYVIPPFLREQAIAMFEDPQQAQQQRGAGFVQIGQRGW